MTEPLIYLIYPYYENPQMLERQIENWNRYSGLLRDRIRVILIDDCSPDNPAEPIFEKCKAPKKLFRVKENIPWGQHHARNVGARVIKGDDSWLFMSDMDVILTPEALNNLIDINPDPGRYHTFARKFVGGVREDKYHCNTFMVTHKNFWAVNGYDCDYCGTYGGDGAFLRQLHQIAPHLHHGPEEKHVPRHAEMSGHTITLWGYEADIIEDANTREWDRYGEMKKKYRKIFDAKRAAGDERSKNPIRWDYERVL